MSKDKSAVGRFTDYLEGIEFPMFDHAKDLYCDRCNANIARVRPDAMKKSLDKRRVEMYASSRELLSEVSDNVDVEDVSGIGVQRLYCPDCSYGRVAFPCEGVTEIIFTGVITPENKIRHVELKDYSPESKGVAWDPIEVFNAVSIYSYKQHQQVIGGIVEGPEDIVDRLLEMDVDIREVVDDEGNIDMTAEEHEEIQRKMNERAVEKAETYAEEGFPDNPWFADS